MTVSEFLKSGLFKEKNVLIIRGNKTNKLIASCSSVTGYHSVLQSTQIMRSEICLLFQNECDTVLYI